MALVVHGERMRLRLKARTGAVRDVRRRVADWAAQNGAETEALKTLALLTSELVTNAVEHGPPDGAITVDARRERAGFRVAVTDQSADPPVVQAPDSHQIRGRGLQLVEMLSSDWGVDGKQEDGKCVWFLVAA